MDTQRSNTNAVTNNSAKRARHPDFADTLTHFDETRKKRRRGRKGLKGTTQKPGAQVDGEVFDINIDEDNEDNEENEVGGRRSHQKGFYKGNSKLLIEHSTIKFRIYLLNVNAFPDAENLQEWTEKCFIEAGKDLYGARHEGEFAVHYLSSHHDSYHYQLLCHSLPPGSASW